MRRNSDNSPQQSSYSVMVPDLRLCTIRLSNDHDRRFVFEIISPQRYMLIYLFIVSYLSFSSHLLQADCQNECEQWISSLQQMITILFKSSIQEMSNTSTMKISDERSNLILASKMQLKQQM